MFKNQRFLTRQNQRFWADHLLFYFIKFIFEKNKNIGIDGMEFLLLTKISFRNFWSLKNPFGFLRLPVFFIVTWASSSTWYHKNTHICGGELERPPCTREASGSKLFVMLTILTVEVATATYDISKISLREIESPDWSIYTQDIKNNVHHSKRITRFSDSVIKTEQRWNAR